MRSKTSNEPPDFDTDSPTLTVAENIAPGKTVGSPVTATDPEGSTVSYSLGGTDVGSFAIDSTSGQITTTDGQLDRETQAEHSVTVTASDPTGNSATNDVTITLTNVNEAPAYATDSTSLSIVEKHGRTDRSRPRRTTSTIVVTATSSPAPTSAGSQSMEADESRRR